MFGSLMTGLALESSDMDIVVTGLGLTERYEMVQELERLADALVEWEHIKDLKEISTATIPVIKAHIDLRAIRKDSEDGKKDTPDEAAPYDEDSGWLLPIDITFDDKQTESLTAAAAAQSTEPFPVITPAPQGGFNGFGAPFGLLGGL